MKVVLFGTGEYYNRYKIWFEEDEIVALIDNSEQKHGTVIDGIDVVFPNEIVMMEYDIIFIMSFYIKSMKAQLIELGVPENKIHHFYDIHDLIYRPSLKKKIQTYGESSVGKTDKGVLLLNQDLTLGGPALALYNAAKVLIKNGYNITFASQIDGPLREILMNDGISVIVDNNLLVETMDECEWIKGYSLIICNTINFHIFLSERDTSVPMVWWLHDALFFYDGVNRKAIESIKYDNLKVWAVGPVSEKAIKTFRPDFYVENLLYSVADVESNNISGENKKMQFVTIGYIEERKGQDVLVDAIKKLPQDKRNKASFLMVGRNTSMLAVKLMEESKDCEEISFTGSVDRNTIDNILTSFDMLICSSREDPMPTVCAEAMMHYTPCIISDAAGTHAYISDMENGLTFHSEDSDNLKEKIEWAIDNRDLVRKMGREARMVFENFFSEKAFEKRIMELIKQ